MKYQLQTNMLIIMMSFMMASCSSTILPTQHQSQEINAEEEPSISQSQVIDIVWDALEPNTSSHNRSNWQVIEVELVIGEDVVMRFEEEPTTGCWFGPKPPENKEINTSKHYWYVLMIPYPATPEPFYGTPSPTAPPLIPEPFLKYAHFLVDVTSGEVMARRLICIVY